MSRNPFTLFASWLKTARRHPGIVDATAACLSTIDPQQFPDARMVLLKDVDERGFVFYTNLQSVKGRSLAKTPRAALTFHWAPLERQVRIQGRTQRVSDAEADAYWRTRPRLTQLGAWASHQSEPLSSRLVLLKDVAKYGTKFKLGAVPRPPHWSGVRLIPNKIEFWQGRTSRLHDRFLYTKSSGQWQIVRLYP